MILLLSVLVVLAILNLAGSALIFLRLRDLMAHRHADANVAETRHHEILQSGGHRWRHS